MPLSTALRRESVLPPTLSFGSTGGDVAILQAALNSMPTSRLKPLKVDGIFGARTLERVREFQSNAGLRADGIVGPLTWGMLEARIVPITPQEFREMWADAYLLLKTEVKAGPEALSFFDRQRRRAELMAFPAAGGIGGRGGQPPVFGSTLVLIGVVAILVAAFVLACLIVLAQRRNAPAPDIAKLEREFEQKMSELDREISTAPFKLIIIVTLMKQTVERAVKDRLKMLEEEMEKCRENNQNEEKCKNRFDKILAEMNDIRRRLTNLPLETPAQRRLTLMGLARSMGFLMMLISDWGRCMGCQNVIFF